MELGRQEVGRSERTEGIYVLERQVVMGPAGIAFKLEA